MINATSDRRLLSRREIIALFGRFGAALSVDSVPCREVGASQTAAEDKAPAQWHVRPPDRRPFFVGRDLERSGHHSPIPPAQAQRGLRCPGDPRFARIAGADDCRGPAVVDLWIGCGRRYSDVATRMLHRRQQFPAAATGVTDGAKGLVHSQRFIRLVLGGRTVHIHSQSAARAGRRHAYDFTSQMYFDERPSRSASYAQAP